jgi:hypothetical protein
MGPVEAAGDTVYTGTGTFQYRYYRYFPIFLASNTGITGITGIIFTQYRYCGILRGSFLDTSTLCLTSI